MAEELTEVPAQAGRSLSHKIGPLPLWAWLGLGVVGAAGGYYLITRNSGASTAASQAAALFPSNLSGAYGPSYSGGGGSSGTSGTSTTTPGSAYANNGSWETAAIAAVTKATGLGASQVKTYLDEYLNGTSPIGSSQAGGSFNSVVQAALTALGNPPTTPSQGNVDSSPYQNNQAWLNSILGNLPNGTSASIIQEITAVVNGTSSSLSQAAADALTNAEGVVGLGPNTVSYTITQPKTPTTTPTPQLPNVSASDVLAAVRSLGTDASQYETIWTQTISGLAGLDASYQTKLQAAYNLLRSPQYQQYVNQTVKGPVVNNGALAAQNAATVINAILSGQAPPPPSSLQKNP